MKIYGYEENAATLLTLREASVVAAPDELRRLSQFLQETADAMEQHAAAFGHEHFRDYCTRQGLVYEGGDVIIARPSD